MNTDPEVMFHIGPGQVKSEEEQKKDFEWFLDAYLINNKLGIWAIKNKDNHFMGAASLNYWKRTNEIHLGYRLKKEFWGKGIGTFVSVSLLEYARKNLKIKTVYATTNQDNFRSQRVLEKTGFRYLKNIESEGIIMRYYAVNLDTRNY